MKRYLPQIVHTISELIKQIEVVKEKIEETKAQLIEKVEAKVAEKLDTALDKVAEMLKKGLKGYIFIFIIF